MTHEHQIFKTMRIRSPVIDPQRAMEERSDINNQDRPGHHELMMVYILSSKACFFIE
jgi:hypothetical protein